MSRLVLALVIVIALAASAYGAAAALSVTSGTLQSGGADVGVCDPTGFTVKYDTMLSDHAPGGRAFVVAAIKFEDVDSACAGKIALVDVLSTSGAPMAFGAAQLDGTGSATVTKRYQSGSGWVAWDPGLITASAIGSLNIVVKDATDYDGHPF